MQGERAPAALGRHPRSLVAPGCGASIRCGIVAAPGRKPMDPVGSAGCVGQRAVEHTVQLGVAQSPSVGAVPDDPL
eukprot:11188119-Lingulodinium_polyedra.AAC.1